MPTCIPSTYTDSKDIPAHDERICGKMKRRRGRGPCRRDSGDRENHTAAEPLRAWRWPTEAGPRQRDQKQGQPADGVPKSRALQNYWRRQAAKRRKKRRRNKRTKKEEQRAGKAENKKKQQKKKTKKKKKRQKKRRGKRRGDRGDASMHMQIWKRTTL